MNDTEDCGEEAVQQQDTRNSRLGETALDQQTVTEENERYFNDLQRNAPVIQDLNDEHEPGVSLNNNKQSQ